MENFKLTMKRYAPHGAQLHYNGLPTGIWIENGLIPRTGKRWYLTRPGMSPNEVALFHRRANVLQACVTFLEGATQGPDESERNAAITALYSCLRTGAVERLPLSLAQQAARLFNCCTDGKEPDWKRFDTLELGGCITVERGTPMECTEGGQTRAKAEFFTIYGHVPNEGVEAITDVISFTDARIVLSELVARSGLPTMIVC